DTSYTDSGEIWNDSSGKGGSLARFAVTQDHLYAVTPQNMKLFNLSDPSQPEYTDSIYMGAGIETIFPYGDNLFIGTQNGMKIYDISIPSAPYELSTYQHITSCDPVVAQDNYAYVTLNSNNDWCGRSVNRLDIIDISNLSNPYKIADYTMQGPEGLGVQGDLLFVCDNGLKVYDVTNKYGIVLLQHFNIKATDVIPNGDNLLVIGEDGLYQYHFNGTELSLLSKIPVEKE
ncbi:MAG TPA: hypothetical protein VJ346_01485, partial [Bacteroidales bacterium]|nr:hypothetical protein [Bacteroidales bacterium]